MYNYTISFAHPDAGARTDAVEAGAPGRRVAESLLLVVPCIKKHCVHIVPATLSFFSPLIKINDWTVEIFML